jgi:osmotically-inducible protein OsmY
VHLSGTLLDERHRGAIRVAAENIPGVKAVEDHLVWIDPVSGMVMPA